MNIHVLTTGSCLNMVGRVPLIPLFLAGNLTPTSQRHSSTVQQHKRSGFPQAVGSCDTAAVDGWSGSNVCEAQVNQWLWQFGRGKQRLGCLTMSVS